MKSSKCSQAYSKAAWCKRTVYPFTEKGFSKAVLTATLQSDLAALAHKALQQVLYDEPRSEMENGLKVKQVR